MADCFENLFVEVDPRQPYSKIRSIATGDLLNVNFWFCFNIKMRRKINKSSEWMPFFLDLATLYPQAIAEESLALHRDAVSS